MSPLACHPLAYLYYYQFQIACLVLRFLVEGALKSQKNKVGDTLGRPTNGYKNRQGTKMSVRGTPRNGKVVKRAKELSWRSVGSYSRRDAAEVQPIFTRLRSGEESLIASEVEKGL